MRAHATSTLWTEPDSAASPPLLRVHLAALPSGEWTFAESGPSTAELRESVAGELYADTTVTGDQRLALNAPNQLLLYEV